jgi:hypothetical protein
MQQGDGPQNLIGLAQVSLFLCADMVKGFRGDLSFIAIWRMPYCNILPFG